jgi:GWxTD domain-containing protein
MLDALRRVNQPRRSTNPRLLSAWGVLEREFGDPAAALEAFEAWVPAAGRQRGLALLEVARTRFLLGRLDGVEPYYSGAVFDDSAAVANYRDDLALIAGDAELRAFDAARGEARAEMLRRFWGRRDAADVRTPGERLREHYRRLFHVRRAFPRFAPDRLAGLTPGFAALLDEVDDRGRIYLRHGEPDVRVTLNTLGIEPNESWRYARAEGDLVLHFVARNEPDVYRLVESLLDVVEYAPAPSPQGRALELERRDAVLLSREALSPLYSRSRRATPDSAHAFLLAERALGRASLINATTTDSYRHRFARPLDAVSDLALFSNGSGGLRLHLAYAVPFQSVGVAWLGPGIAYPLRLQMVVWEPEGTTVVRLDSLVRPVTWASPQAAWLAGVVSLDVPAGRLRVSAVLQDGEDAGTVLPIRSLELVQPGDTLWLSDLALGVRATPWAVDLSDGGRVSLAPAASFARSQELELAYEVVGPAGLPVASQATLMRIDEPAGVLWSRRRAASLDRGRVVLREPVDLRRLTPGRYRVEVTVMGGGGVSRRWREFEVGR